MDEKERNWLMGQLREADAIGDIERANKIADILRGGGPQPQGPTQEMLRAVSYTHLRAHETDS